MTPDMSLAGEVARISLLSGRFTLRSGAVSSLYFDKYRFEAEPALLRRVADRMLALLPADAEILADPQPSDGTLSIKLQSGRPAVRSSGLPFFDQAATSATFRPTWANRTASASERCSRMLVAACLTSENTLRSAQVISSSQSSQRL